MRQVRERAVRACACARCARAGCANARARRGARAVCADARARRGTRAPCRSVRRFLSPGGALVVSDGAASPGRPGLGASPFPQATTESRTSVLSHAGARRLREAGARGRAEKCKVACRPALAFSLFSVRSLGQFGSGSEAPESEEAQQRRSRESGNRGDASSRRHGRRRLGRFQKSRHTAHSEKECK